MSGHWITLIPEDPRFLPEESRQTRARDRFTQIAPEAEEVTVRVFAQVQFFDCGQNFERVVCPTCRLEIAMEWWQDRMDEDYTDGFALAKFSMPCCDAVHALHELVYEFPQGFGQFALDANIGELDETHKRDLEAILGSRLRVIDRHI